MTKYVVEWRVFDEDIWRRDHAPVFYNSWSEAAADANRSGYYGMQTRVVPVEIKNDDGV